MRQIREVLRLRFVCERSQREIAMTIGASSATIWDYLDRARRAQLDIEKALAMDDAALEALLFPPPPSLSRTRPLPNWPLLHRELGRRGVTLDLLWNEYKAQEPEGFGYSWFCKHYERWAAALPVTLRQTHTPGEKLFIDYSGNRLGIVDPHTGEIREAELFVATLGASNYTYAEVTWTQQLEDWIGSHVRALNFIGGCVEIVVFNFVAGNKIRQRTARHTAEPVKTVDVTSEQSIESHVGNEFDVARAAIAESGHECEQIRSFAPAELDPVDLHLIARGSLESHQRIGHRYRPQCRNELAARFSRRHRIPATGSRATELSLESSPVPLTQSVPEDRLRTVSVSTRAESPRAEMLARPASPDTSSSC